MKSLEVSQEEMRGSHLKILMQIREKDGDGRNQSIVVEIGEEHTELKSFSGRIVRT